MNGFGRAVRKQLPKGTEAAAERVLVLFADQAVVLGVVVENRQKAGAQTQSHNLISCFVLSHAQLQVASLEITPTIN
jgi:hypothetical protein